VTPVERARFEDDGYLVLEGFVDTDACAELIERAEELVHDFVPEVVSIFTTHEQTRHSDEWFMTSGDKVRCFFEEEAFAPDGSLRQPKELSINKIGHAAHDLDPVFDRFSRSPAMAAIGSELFEDPRLLQSMYIFKQPRIGGEVTLHQDSTFLYTDPMTVTGFWFALQDATIDNGCLWALPGGHRLGLKQRFVRDESSDGTRFEVLDDTPFPTDGLVPLEAPAGTLVLLDGLLPHRSGPNRSDHSRHAYSVHVIDGTADYPDDNWLQRPGLPLRGF
jgi:phytanoyl-CoA hydroxylase